LRTQLIAIACLLIVTVSAPVQGRYGASWRTELRTELSVCRLFGSTAYHLKALTEDPASPGTLTEIRSELKFPLDVTLVGLTVGWESSPESPWQWDLEAGISVNMTDPSSRMTDQDWIGATQVGYTESDAELSLMLLTAEVRYRFLERRRVSLSLLACFTHQRISQDIIGFEGWFIHRSTGNRQNVSGTEPAINYEVIYATPQLGARSTIQLGRFTVLTLQSSAGLVFASDTDDHLLRGRFSKANGLGFGLHSIAELSLMPGFALSRGISVNFVGQLWYFRASGDQTQRWYRDEGDIPAGTIVDNIPHQFRSYQFSISLQVCFTHSEPTR